MFDFGIDKTMIVVGAAVGTFVAGTLAAPQFFPAAFAAEPQSHLLDRGKDLFPLPFDTNRLRKFNFTFEAPFSAEAQRVDTVKKIGFGHKDTVTIVTTPSGVYSSDAITSPYVKYPGIEVTPKHRYRSWSYSSWVSSYGSGSWTRFNSGSIIYYTYTFKQAART